MKKIWRKNTSNVSGEMPQNFRQRNQPKRKQFTLNSVESRRQSTDSYRIEKIAQRGGNGSSWLGEHGIQRGHRLRQGLAVAGLALLWQQLTLQQIVKIARETFYGKWSACQVNRRWRQAIDPNTWRAANVSLNRWTCYVLGSHQHARLSGLKSGHGAVEEGCCSHFFVPLYLRLYGTGSRVD